MSYTNPLSRASLPDPHPNSNRRAAYAREAVRLEFRPQDAKTLDQDDFVDRRPHEAPRRLDEVGVGVVHDSGMKALRRQLIRAAEAENTHSRIVALKAAQKMARVLGVAWANPSDNEEMNYG